MKNKKNKEKTKKDSKYAWISLVLALFFWIPLINVIVLQISMFFGVAAMIRAKKHPDRYSGFLIALIPTIFAFISFIIGGYILILNLLGKNILS